MYARCGHVGVRRRVLNHGDIGDGGAARDGTFKQVVAQHLTFGQTTGQHCMHRAYVEQSFASEGALVEQVLIHLGACSAVRVNAALSGEQPVIQRERFWRRQWRHDARLQDAVTADNAGAEHVELRLILRVGCHTDQLAQTAGRQLCVAVQRDDVLCVRSDHRGMPQIDERRL